jgi:dimethylglycine dehydrogenase
MILMKKNELRFVSKILVLFFKTTLGSRHVGARAQNWLRQEKSYRAFGTELGRDATPLEAASTASSTSARTSTARRRCWPWGSARNADSTRGRPGRRRSLGREALYAGPTRVGRLTSGGWSAAFGRSIGLGYVTPAHAEVGTRLQVRMQDALWPAEVVPDSPYDPENARIRADA